MAVNVNEKKVMLKTVTSNTNSDGSIKKRSITVRNIDSNATNDSLYALSKGVGSLVEGNLASSSKITEEVFEEQA
ncbi:hypothetical protein [uncultured Peptoniphilus sp.]|uniref:DUF1659 domain-containing protein n=1 Tax=uncultured Peptoniphilus sp. TaxID=254354 RepID=UPI0026166602|nr:hypothetical protein [uncultured Peptoniphilus sp.]